MAGLTLRFHIKMLSDYHVGGGHGLGTVADSALHRDADGVPVIRGTSLAGLLRDAAYRLSSATALGKYFKPEACLAIFGTPETAKAWCVSSARPASLETPLPTRRTVLPGHVTRRARVSPRLRRAEPRKLFSQEQGSARLEFAFRITWPDNSPADLDEASLLVASARMVRQLGSSRRRGMGECLFELVEADNLPEGSRLPADQTQHWFIDRFASTWLRGAITRRQPVPATARTSTTGTTESRGSGGATHTCGAAESRVEHADWAEPLRYLCIVRIDEPAIVSQRPVAGNRFYTGTAIPGSVLRGAFAALAAEAHDLSDPAAYAGFVSVFLRDDVSLPWLYPAYHQHNVLYPAVPVPLDLLTCKALAYGETNAWHWGVTTEPLGFATRPEVGRCPECARLYSRETPLEPTTGYALMKTHDGCFVKAEDPGVSSETHIRIDLEHNRTSTGDLYSYSSLDIGQYFVGELLVRNPTAWCCFTAVTSIQEGTPFRLRLGKATRRGYGLVTMWIARRSEGVPLWVHLPLSQRVTDPTSPLALTLLTDTILCDEWGRAALSFKREGLERELRMGPLEVINSFAGLRMIDGFNAKLGLPRWRDLALVAGSTVGLRLLDPPSDWEDRMRAVEDHGLGCRRNEGFGRCAFNHPVYRVGIDIGDAWVALPRSLRLGEESGQPEFMKEAQDLKPYWHELGALGASLRALGLGSTDRQDSLLDAKCNAVARWLAANAHVDPHDLAVRLGTLGTPCDTIRRLVGGDAEYGTRAKDNFFAHGVASQVMSKIRDALDSLSGLPKACWPPGVSRLAEVVAQSCSGKGE